MMRVRWRVVLPLVMLTVSTLLMLIAVKQQPMLWKAGTGWEVPARVLNFIVNGPGFYPFVPVPIPRSVNSHLNYDGARLLGIVVFWFLIGWSLDRRRTGQSLGQNHPILAGILFIFGAIACGVCGFGLAVAEFGDASFWMIIARFPLWSSGSVTLAFVIWLIALCAYFCRRVFILARRNLNLVR